VEPLAVGALNTMSITNWTGATTITMVIIKTPINHHAHGHHLECVHADYHLEVHLGHVRSHVLPENRVIWRSELWGWAAGLRPAAISILLVSYTLDETCLGMRQIVALSIRQVLILIAIRLAILCVSHRRLLAQPPPRVRSQPRPTDVHESLSRLWESGPLYGINKAA